MKLSHFAVRLTRYEACRLLENICVRLLSRICSMRILPGSVPKLGLFMVP